jgi:hypothetical protein
MAEGLISREGRQRRRMVKEKAAAQRKKLRGAKKGSGMGEKEEES